jgi:hypothetical protein
MTWKKNGGYWMIFGDMRDNMKKMKKNEFLVKKSARKGQFWAELGKVSAKMTAKRWGFIWRGKKMKVIG